MGDERRDPEQTAKENPQDEREGGYGSPEEREEELKRKVRGKDREEKDNPAD